MIERKNQINDYFYGKWKGVDMSKSSFTTIEILNIMNGDIQQPLHYTKNEQNQAIVEAEEALEKQTPMIVTEYEEDRIFCPSCKSELLYDTYFDEFPIYCEICGQRLVEESK